MMKITKILNDKGYMITRRTVSKYRVAKYQSQDLEKVKLNKEKTMIKDFLCK